MSKKNKDLATATSTLIGFTLGAGIFGIPYAIAQVGFIYGVLSILIVGSAISLLYLMIGEICLRTKKKHQLVGYANVYLGQFGKNIMVILLLCVWYGAMIAYTIKIGEFFSALFGPIVNISPIYSSIIFAILSTYLIFRGLSIVAKGENIIIILILTLVAIIGIFSFKSINYNNLLTFNIENFWIPFGVILFAFSGSGAIPEMKEELRGNKKVLKKAIIIGTIISLSIYIIFSLFVVGVSGQYTTDGAILGLSDFLGYKILLLGGIFGILVMSNAFVVVALAIKEVFSLDYKKNNFKSTLYTCVVPFIIAICLILFEIENIFFKIIIILGTLFEPIAGLLFVLILWKAKKFGDRKPEYSIKYSKFLGVILILFLLAGFIIQIQRILSGFLFV